jgi:hypothetical protein
LPDHVCGVFEGWDGEAWVEWFGVAGRRVLASRSCLSAHGPPRLFREGGMGSACVSWFEMI